MTSVLRTRARGQAIVFAAIGVVSLVGAAAMVIDLGVFFVIQRQMQNAADTAALAAAWYEPMCDPVAQGPGGCQSAASWTAVHAVPPTCTGLDQVPCAVALAYANDNLDLATGLCSGPYANAARPQVGSYPGNPPYHLANGSGIANIYIVTIDCYAPYWFGRIIPNLPLSHHISASSAATVGWRGANGDLAGLPLPPPNNILITRLFRIP